MFFTCKEFLSGFRTRSQFPNNAIHGHSYIQVVGLVGVSSVLLASLSRCSRNFRSDSRSSWVMGGIDAAISWLIWMKRVSQYNGLRYLGFITLEVRRLRPTAWLSICVVRRPPGCEFDKSGTRSPQRERRSPRVGCFHNNTWPGPFSAAPGVAPYAQPGAR